MLAHKEALARAIEKPEERRAELLSLEEQRKAIYLNIFINLFDSVLALHWSLFESPIPPISVAVSGSISSFAGFYRKWKNT